MSVDQSKQASGNLTQMEILALDSALNVSDGHPRQALTGQQRRIIDRLPEIFHDSARAPYSMLERSAQRAYLEAVGQSHAPIDKGRVASSYSSSVAMLVLASCLAREMTTTVALVHPTFDNIPDIMRGAGLRLVPVEEEDIAHGHVGVAAEAEPDCVFITTPNNPTGRVVSQESLRKIAEWCERHGAILALDVSFRAFDERAQFDHYKTLDETGVEYVILEDTGKIWPMLELKFGLLAYSESCRLAVDEVQTEVQLNVSPLVLGLVQEFARDAADGGFGELRRLVATNRAILDAALTRDGVSDGLEESRISVARIELPHGLSAVHAWELLRSENVDTLPCDAFHWDRAEEGSRFLRVALARDSEVVAEAAEAIASLLSSW